MTKLKEYKKKYPTIKTTTLANVPHTNILNFRFVEEFYYDEDIEKWVDEPAKPNETQKGGGPSEDAEKAKKAAAEAEKEAAGIQKRAKLVKHKIDRQYNLDIDAHVKEAKEAAKKAAEEGSPGMDILIDLKSENWGSIKVERPSV